MWPVELPRSYLDAPPRGLPEWSSAKLLSRGHRLGCSRTLYFLLTVLLIGSAVIVPAGARPPTGPTDFQVIDHRGAVVPAQYAVAPIQPDGFRNVSAVEKAIGFLLRLQPEGTYILTSPDVDDVVHMDVAHAAIALAKVGRLAESEAAMSWMLSLMTLPGALDQYQEVTVEGDSARIDYAGSWYDHYRTTGEPKRNLTRGRGEGVGMGLIAIYTIYREDPSYARRDIEGISVLDRVALAVGYLTSPAMQHPDGRFNHRPDYPVSFGEEAARMALGLELASKMLEDAGEHLTAQLARDGAARGLNALRSGDGLNYGMAFDYYAMGLWGLATPEQAQEELRLLRAAGMVTPDGVRNWDWQVHQAEDWRDRLFYWAASQTIGPAQTFDWAIASIAAGNSKDALAMERRWLPLQREDGSFAGCYVLGLRLGLGPPNSYTTARFILLERMLKEALSPTPLTVDVSEDQMAPRAVLAVSLGDASHS